MVCDPHLELRSQLLTVSRAQMFYRVMNVHEGFYVFNLSFYFSMIEDADT